MLVFLLFCCSAILGRSTDKSCSNKNACIRNGRQGLCLKGTCFFPFKPTAQPFLVKIRYPLDNPYARNASVDASKMFIRGSGLGLSWEEGKTMKRTIKDTWEIQLLFTIPESPNAKKQPARFEFRVYLEDSRDMLGPNFVITLPLSSNANDISKLPEFWAYPWFFSKNVSEVKRTVYSPQLGEKRDLFVTLPPSFHENIYKHYETLIVNDGDKLTNMVPQLTVLMVERALIKEVLAIGIPNNYSERTQLFVVSNGSDPQCINGDYEMPRCGGCVRCNSTTCSYEQHIDDYRRCKKWVKMSKPARGQLYLDFIQDTVISECKSKYRARSGPENFGIIGFSLGGLVSCHAIWTRPQTFGSAACMSSSFWWPFPINASFPDDAQYEFITKTLNEHRGARPRQKIYIDVGSKEGYLMISPARNASKILASTPYFELNKNLWFYIWEGEYHDFKTSVQRMWIPLIAFYGTEGSSQADIRKVMNENETNGARENCFVCSTLFLTGILSYVTSMIV